ncbi:MAG: hypothetical protein KDD89_13625, partial [Anaerolineales bacterium]|nr:hypothetical protein [Anaerolineales bacterium]
MATDAHTTRPWLGRAKRYDWLIAFALYALLTLLMTWPGITRLSTELIGGRDDLLIHQWTYWWVKEALLTGQNPFYTTLLYWPQGASLTSHNIAWFNIALWLPLQALLGHIAAYNLVVLLAFTLNGWTMYLFARAELGHKLAAFTAGVVFAYWPYTMSHYDHANMYVVFGVPLIMLGVRRLTEAERPRVNTAVFTALAIALTGIIRWQLLIMSLPVVGLYIAYRLVQTGVTRHKLL